MENQFKPFEKVLVRDADTQPWKCGIFSHCDKNENLKYACIGSLYAQCIPYNKNTAHLVGTTNPYTLPQPKTYHVEWGMDSQMEQQDYTDEEFKNFIETAVLRNKDISNFKVTRICG